MSERAIAVLTLDEVRAAIRQVVDAALDERGEQEPIIKPELVDGNALAQIVGGASRTTLHRWRQAGMPAIPVGDTFRYRPRDVLAWLDAGGAAQLRESAELGEAGTNQGGAKPASSERKRGRFSADSVTGAGAGAATSQTKGAP
jgi:hypothetical protein